MAWHRYSSGRYLRFWYERTSATIRSTEGLAASSRTSAAGKGTCGAVVRTIRPPSSPKHSSARREVTSAPYPQCRGFSSTVSTRPVLAVAERIACSVEGDKRTEVEDSNRDALFCEARCFERSRNHGSEGSEDHVAEVAPELGGSERLDVLAIGDLGLFGMRSLVLARRHRIRITNGCRAKSLHVGRTARCGGGWRGWIHWASPRMAMEVPEAFAARRSAMYCPSPGNVESAR
jgi:hypothetical protein